MRNLDVVVLGVCGDRRGFESYSRRPERPHVCVQALFSSRLYHSIGDPSHFHIARGAQLPLPSSFIGQPLQMPLIPPPGNPSGRVRTKDQLLFR